MSRDEHFCHECGGTCPGAGVTQVVLCEACAAAQPDARPTGMYSVDGCDRCDNGGAGWCVWEVPA